MFLFFSNRMGCLTSIVVSVVGSLVVILVMRGCHAEASNVKPAPIFTLLATMASGIEPPYRPEVRLQISPQTR